MEVFLFSMLAAIVFLGIVAFKCATEGHEKPKKKNEELVPNDPLRWVICAWISRIWCSG